MRILGIDPGLNFSGWGIIDVNNSCVKFIDCGIINPSKKSSDSKRLHEIYEGLKEVIITFSPEVASLEETFVNKNPKGALKLGYSRGVALMIPAIYGLEVFENVPIDQASKSSLQQNNVRQTPVANHCNIRARHGC